MSELNNNVIPEEILKEWQNDPTLWMQVFWPDVILWEKIYEIAQAVADGHRKISIRSCHGSGKTWTLARLALWFVTVYKPSKVLSTAPTWHQVRNLLWKEMNTAHAQAEIPLGGEMKQMEWRITDDNFALGISTRQEGGGKEFGAVKMQGFHSPHLLVLLDEAAGVRPEVWTAVDSLVTGEHNIIIAIGNPASPSGPFYDTFSNPTWHNIHISAYDHPNVKTGREIIPGAVTKQWIEDKKVEWGEDSPIFQAKVLGNFPDEGEDTLFRMSKVLEATKRELKWEGWTYYGIDVARFGDDKTIVYKRKGLRFELEAEVRKTATTEAAGRVTRLYLEDEFAKGVGVDDTGVGGGVTDILRENGKINVTAINFGEKATDSERFYNLKAEMFWMLREEFENGTIQIPDDSELINQLTGMKFTYTSKGQIKIESKADMKKRGMKSPDKADALVICYYAGKRNSVRIKQERDPMITRGMRSIQF